MHFVKNLDLSVQSFLEVYIEYRSMDDQNQQIFFPNLYLIWINNIHQHRTNTTYSTTTNITTTTTTN